MKKKIKGGKTRGERRKNKVQGLYPVGLTTLGNLMRIEIDVGQTANYTSGNTDLDIIKWEGLGGGSGNNRGSSDLPTGRVADGAIMCLIFVIYYPMKVYKKENISYKSQDSAT